MTTPDYTTVTELSGDEVTRAQVERICHRYYWAGPHCDGKDVLEVACGTGQGLAYLQERARRVYGGDLSGEMLATARAHYGDRVGLAQLDAQAMPFAKATFDVILCFEAIYYLAHAHAFAAECRRLLRPGGRLLVATANKDLYDFNPSPFTHEYFGVAELGDLLGGAGFEVDCFGAFPVGRAGIRQRILRPIKAIASKLHLIPQSMEGKKRLKKLVFGSLVTMPHEIAADQCDYAEPTPLPPGEPDREHQVIYAAASLTR